MIKRSLSWYEEPELPESVVSKLHEICAKQKQPWPDGDVLRLLARVTENSAVETLDKVLNTPRIKLTVNKFITYMVNKYCTLIQSPAETASSGNRYSPASSAQRRLRLTPPDEDVTQQPRNNSGQSPFSSQFHSQTQRLYPSHSAPAPAFTEKSGNSGESPFSSHPQLKLYSSPPAESLTEQSEINRRQSPNSYQFRIPHTSLYTPQQLSSSPPADKAFTVQTHLLEQSRNNYSSGSPVKDIHTSYQRLPTPVHINERFQGEAFDEQTPVLGLPFLSSGSPLKFLGTSNGPAHHDERFQGEVFTEPTPVLGLPLYSFGSTSNDAGTSYRQLSAPVQFNERFQGEEFTQQTPVIGQPPYSCNSPSKAIHNSPLSPIQRHERFQGDAVTRSPVLNKRGYHGEAHLEALGELEFRRQFLILSYAGGEKLEDFITPEEIRQWKDWPMVKFEDKVWGIMGRKCISRDDRRSIFDWDSGSTYVYHCYVSMNGSYTFKGPYLHKVRQTLLQKELGDGNVLMVKFAKDEMQRGHPTACDHHYTTYMKVAREGILVGLRRYSYFVFKDGGNEEKKKNTTSSSVKCYFVRVSSDALIDRGVDYKLNNKTMHEARCRFMHAHTLPSISNYMARFSLILSKTTSLKVDWSLVKVECIDEEYCLDESGNRIFRGEKPLIHTDGTGFISEDLALLCPNIEVKGKYTSNEHIKGLPDPVELENHDMEKKIIDFRTQEPPLLIQCRLFHNGTASKGTLLVNKRLRPKTIQIRPSMLKVETDPTMSNNQTVNSLEIVGTSTPPRNTFLSRILIALLLHGGVPEEFFMHILNKALEDAHGVFCKTRAALKVAEKHGEIDDNFLGKLMILFGIPLEESYLRYRLSVLMKEEHNSLQKGRLYIPDSYNLMGTADPTGILKKDEVCVILKDGQVSGKVLVYRYPGLHFGDIHVLNATYVRDLESFVGNAKYGIFFSCKGPRSVADEMGGGDFDGDMYWVSRNPQLLEWYRPSDPWVEASTSTHKVPSKRPTELSAEDREDVLFTSFLKTRFEPSFAMSEAADNWLAWMDQFLTLGASKINERNIVKEKILQLVDKYYDALDAPKKGGKVVVPKELKVPNFPHYMGKNNFYTSTSILGKIYDTVKAHQTEEWCLEEVEKLPILDIDEVPLPCMKKWWELYEQYKKEMTSALKDDDKQGKNQSADVIIRKYKKILYEADDFEDSRRPTDDILNEAHAIYHLCYDHAWHKKSVKACSFAWRVAGKALCHLHAKKKNDRCFTMVASVMKDIL